MLDSIKPLYQVTFQGGNFMFIHTWLPTTAIRKARKAHQSVKPTDRVTGCRIVGTGSDIRG